MAPASASRLRSGSPTSAPSQPPARAERVEAAQIFSGPAHHVQQPEDRQRRQPPAEREPEAVPAAALAHQRDADADQRDGTRSGRGR